MLKKIGLLAAAAFVASVSVASAQQWQNWGTNGGWRIWKNQTTGGCFMERQTAEGIVLHLGSVKTMTGAGSDRDFGFLGLYIPGARPPATGGNPGIILTTGPNRYIAQTYTRTPPGFWGGYITSGRNTNLARDIATRAQMTGTTSGGESFIINWDQSNVSQAGKRLLTCEAS